jgi:cell division protein FtsB
MKAELSAQSNSLNREIDELIKMREILSKPEALEMVVRKELGYIRPGEVIFEKNRLEDR